MTFSINSTIPAQCRPAAIPPQARQYGSRTVDLDDGTKAVVKQDGSVASRQVAAFVESFSKGEMMGKWASGQVAADDCHVVSYGKYPALAELVAAGLTRISQMLEENKAEPKTAIRTFVSKIIDNRVDTGETVEVAKSAYGAALRDHGVGLAWLHAVIKPDSIMLQASIADLATGKPLPPEMQISGPASTKGFVEIRTEEAAQGRQDFVFNATEHPRLHELLKALIKNAYAVDARKTEVRGGLRPTSSFFGEVD